MSAFCPCFINAFLSVHPHPEYVQWWLTETVNTAIYSEHNPMLVYSEVSTLRKMCIGSHICTKLHPIFLVMGFYICQWPSREPFAQHFSILSPPPSKWIKTIRFWSVKVQTYIWLLIKFHIIQWSLPPINWKKNCGLRYLLLFPSLRNWTKRLLLQ